MFLAGLMIFVLPAMSWAAEEGAQHQVDSDLYRVLILLAIVGAAYIITHLLLERLAERFGFVTGTEYIVLGALLGPVFGVLDTETIGALTPVNVLGTGSLGLLAGLNLRFRGFTPFRMRAFQSGITIALGTLLTVVGVPLLALIYFDFPGGVDPFMPILLCSGAVAVVVNTGPLRAMAAFWGAEGSTTDFSVQVARFCSSVGIIAFGLIFCFYNETTVPFDVDPPFVWMTWLGIHLLLGSVLGLIFAGFLIRELSDDMLITIFMGMVIFTSGFAYYLHLSPIFVNFVLGVVLINVSQHVEHVHKRLLEIRRPLYIILFFFAGAGWALSAEPIWGYLLVFAYLVLRFVGRMIGSIGASRITKDRSYGSGLYRALQGSGALSVAMLLDFTQVFGNLEYAGLMYNGLLIAIVLSEIASYPLTRNWLIDVADVASPEKRGSSTQTQEAS
ncbi:Kef-type K+ transport system membrane component KefB [Bradymonas sediminis]|nr:Kef-type K+ transport system membrane component KefB [Bradymonas sediminis]